MSDEHNCLHLSYALLKVGDVADSLEEWAKEVDERVDDLPPGETAHAIRYYAGLLDRIVNRLDLPRAQAHRDFVTEVVETLGDHHTHFKQKLLRISHALDRLEEKELP